MIKMTNTVRVSYKNTDELLFDTLMISFANIMEKRIKRILRAQIKRYSSDYHEREQRRAMSSLS